VILEIGDRMRADQPELVVGDRLVRAGGAHVSEPWGGREGGRNPRRCNDGRVARGEAHGSKHER
jgi:hypothetical protein